MNTGYKFIAICFSILVTCFFLIAFAHAAVCYLPQIGGTGTCATPTYGQVLVGQSNGVYTPQATSTLGISSGGSPGGLNTQIQYNNSGAFGADANLIWDKIDQIIGISNPTIDNTLPDGLTPGIVFGNNSNGYVSIQTQNATTSGNSGTELDIVAGNGLGSGNGGIFQMIAGNAGATGNGGDMEFFSGKGGASSGNGGEILFQAQSAQGGNGNGGDVTFDAGAANGSGTAGQLDFKDGASSQNAVLNTASLSSSDKTFTFPNWSGNFLVSSSTSLSQANNGNIGVGTAVSYTDPNNLDQLTVNGRVNYGDWHFVECNPLTGNTSTTFNTNTSNLCPNFQFLADTSGGLTFNPNGTNAGPNNTAITGIANVRLENVTTSSGYSNTSPVAANSGAALLAGPGGGNFIFATSTPVIETAARIDYPQNATSSRFYIGFFDLAFAVGTKLEQEPTVGCYFVASSSLADWQAQCRTTVANTTTVDTGIASSTSITNTGGWMRFRIETTPTAANFYMETKNNSMSKVASINTNYPSTSISASNGIYAGTYLGRYSAGLADALDINYLRIWYDQPIFNY